MTLSRFSCCLLLLHPCDDQLITLFSALIHLCPHSTTPHTSYHSCACTSTTSSCQYNTTATSITTAKQCQIVSKLAHTNTPISPITSYHQWGPSAHVPPRSVISIQWRNPKSSLANMCWNFWVSNGLQIVPGNC